MTDKINYSNLEFHEELGEGAFGTVHRVTFKTPYKGFIEAAAKNIRSLRILEVEVMRKLHHPYIVTLIGFYHDGPINMILMEYAKNGSLHDYLQDHTKALPQDLKRRWAKESALAIQYLHLCKYLHRDIKPQNCVLFEDNVLKLCDFGLTRKFNRSATFSSEKGSYPYMAPEIININDDNKSTYSIYADIYAYGMLLLAICTREAPFHDMEWAHVVYHVGKGELQPVVPSTTPKDLADLMKQCWNVEPKQRPTSDVILSVLCRSESVEKKSDPRYHKSTGAERFEDLSMSPTNGPFPAKRSRPAFNAHSHSSKPRARVTASVVHKPPTTSLQSPPGDAETSLSVPHLESATLTVPRNVSTGVTEGVSEPVKRTIQALPQDQLLGTGGQAQGSWKLTREFIPKQQMDVIAPTKVAWCNQDMVVAGAEAQQGEVYILDTNKECRSSFKLCDENFPNRVRALRVSPQGHILVVDGSRFVKGFDVTGKLLHNFHTLNEDENPNTRVSVCSIAIDKEGRRVLVGDSSRQIITIHTYPDGRFVKRLCKLPVDASIDINSKDQILCYYTPPSLIYPLVVALDFSGKKVFEITPKINLEVRRKEKACARGMHVSHADDSIYIAICVYRVSIRINTGHIHKYSSTGEFQECIAQGLYQPSDLSVSRDGPIAVANRRTMLVYEESNRSLVSF